ncbi:MAG: L-threonylcarbamoyladenylate synthase [Nanobdellota archaeon]
MTSMTDDDLSVFKSAIHDSIIIYPTDTIYGIGCDAQNTRLVLKLRRLKSRSQKPFSVIAPSKEWILKHCKTTRDEIDTYLPGPYTLLLEKKDPSFLSAVSPTPLLGIRIPAHPITKAIQQEGVPFVTTSVNISGEKPAINIATIDSYLLDQVDLIIDVGTLSGTPSTLIQGGRRVKR